MVEFSAVVKAVRGELKKQGVRPLTISALVRKVEPELAPLLGPGQHLDWKLESSSTETRKMPGLVQQALDALVSSGFATRRAEGSAVYHDLTDAGKGDAEALNRLQPGGRKQSATSQPAASGGKGAAGSAGKQGKAVDNAPPNVSTLLAKKCLGFLKVKGVSQMSSKGLKERLTRELGITEPELQQMLRDVTDGSSETAIKAALGIDDDHAAAQTDSPAGNLRSKARGGGGGGGAAAQPGNVLDLRSPVHTPVAARTLLQDESPCVWFMVDGELHAYREDSPGYTTGTGSSSSGASSSSSSSSSSSAAFDSPQSKKSRH